MRINLFGIILTLFSVQLWAQEPENEAPPSPNAYTIGLSVGTGGMVVRDRVFTNFLYKANYVPLDFFFESRNEKQKFKIGMKFLNNPKFTTEMNRDFEYKGDYGDFYESEYNGLSIHSLKSTFWNIYTSQVFMLNKTRDKKINVFLGFDFNLLKFQKNFLQFEYSNKLTDRIYNAGFVLNLERNFNEKHLLLYELSVPVISHVSRTLENTDSEPVIIQSSRFTILASSAGIGNTLTYRYKPFRNFSLMAAFEFRYLQVRFPAKEQWAYTHGILGMALHF